MNPVTDDDILRQLEGAPEGMTAAAPMTAAALETLSATPPPFDYRQRLQQILSDPTGMQAMTASPQDIAGIRNSPFGGYARGLRDPFDQAAAVLARGFQSIAPRSLKGAADSMASDVAAANKAAEQDYQTNWRQGQPPSFDVGRLAGNIHGTSMLGYAMPGAAAPSMLARMGSGAIAGAASGALQPVQADAPDFWNQVRNNAAIGGLTGAAAPPVFGALSRVISPSVSPDVQTLLDAGVTRMTPGQVLGGTANRIEQAATSLPVAGDFIKNARRDAVMQFDQAAINRALEPIGDNLEAKGVGRDAIGEMQRKIGDAYDAVKPQLGWATASPASAAAQTGLSDLSQAVGSTMPQKYASEFQDALDTLIKSRLSPGGGMTGPSFHEAKSDLGKLAIGQYGPQSNFWDKKLGSAYFQAQQVLRDAQRVADPAAADALQNVDNAFAHSLRVNRAAASLGGEPGAFSPAQLQAAVKSLDPSMRKNAFAAGDALMQDLADAGKGVLGNTVPDSGTPYRHAIQLGMGALLGEHLPLVSEYTIPAALGYGALAGGAGLAYSPVGRSITTRLLASRPGFARPVGDMLRSLAPAASVSGAPVFGALGGP